MGISLFPTHIVRKTAAFWPRLTNRVWFGFQRDRSALLAQILIARVCPIRAFVQMCN